MLPTKRESIMTDQPKSFNIRPEGAMSIKTQSDGTVNAVSDKPVTIDLGTIEAIGIGNLVDVESHDITRVAGITSHFIRLHGGGDVVLAFNEQGKIIQCQGLNVRSTVVNGSELVFSKKLSV